MATKSEAKHGNLTAALVVAQSEITAPTKDREVEVFSKRTNSKYKFKYATMSSMVEALRPILTRHGLWFVQFVHDGHMVTRITHDSGETLDCPVPMLALAGTPQEAGSLITYFRRYSFQAAFALVAEEEDDANIAEGNSYTPHERANGNGHAPITDSQRDLIQTLAPAAGKTLQQICEAYKIGSLKELTEAQASKLIDRLRSKEREPA